MKRIAAFALTCAMAAPVYAQTIATVNGKNLTQKDLDQFVAVLVEQGAKDSPELREQVKQEMVNRLAVVQAAEKAGIDKTNQVQQELELARQSILVRALMADYLKKNPVTDADLTKEYNTIKAMEEGQQEYKVRHILVKDEAAAKDLLAKIKSKKVSFAEAAKKDSIDTGSGQQGGDLGWAPSSTYVPEFAQAVEKMKKGELSAAPVQSQFGWHIIQVDDARPVTFPAMAEVKPQLEEMMRQRKLAEYQQKILKEANIK